MQQSEVADLFGPILRQNGERRRFSDYAAVLLLVLVLGGWGYSAWRNTQAPSIESIAISNVQTESDNSLCPGDVLNISYDIAIDGLGVVVWDSSTLHNGRPVIFGTARRFIVDGPIAIRINDDWTIPPYTSDINPQLSDWEPGEYKRYIAISPLATYTSRFTPPALLVVPFEIRSDCGVSNPNG